MWTFLKKDMLVLVRDKTELAVLVLMPLILTAILGFALGSIMSGDTESIEAKIAVVQQDDPESGVETFLSEIDSLPIPDQAKVEMGDAAESYNPAAIIEEAIKETELYELDYLNYQEAKDALQEEEVVAILRIPEGFTYDALTNLMLENGSGAELFVEKDEHDAFSNSVFEDVVDVIVDQMNTVSAIAKVSGENGVSAIDETAPSSTEQIGGMESVTDRDSMSSVQYYTFGMIAMFALYIASTVATKAYNEQLQHVFNRIILSGKHPFIYLSGKGISSFLLVCLQVLILISASIFIFNSFDVESLVDIAGMALITVVYALCIGAFGALLTSLTMRANSEAVTGIFSGFIVSILAFLGGSFIPKTQMPDIINLLGEWTPNGLALTAYLQWSQGLGFEYIVPSLTRILVITVVIWLISIIIFPRKKVV
ncbi:ABC transporter permease [Piscibacillus halophilus]|uniref:ABC-2 type transport system permease protein n=1 Tax=Piscibacillus halophilus TaxID=571933 RepID=A0A1H9DLH9_9BACI|nr:ABC transporter permease [Piscibacillus halophilus]SEQ14324.1 ABC-2 type transport system permease protein [Piscibacillus halophilus]